MVTTSLPYNQRQMIQERNYCKFMRDTYKDVINLTSLFCLYISVIVMACVCCYGWIKFDSVFLESQKLFLDFKF